MDGGTWFLGIIIILLVILAIVFLILWLVNRGKINPQNSQLSIKNLVFSLVNLTTVQAKWSETGNSGNQITLYADTIPINFNASGKAVNNPKIKMSQTVTSGTKTVSLSNLTPNTKYFLAVTVTNPKFTGFNSEPGQIYTGEVPIGSFIIQDINAPGAISLDINNNTTVLYDKNVNKTEVNDIWMYNPANFTISTRGVGANSGTVPTLFNDNGVLSSQDLSTLNKNENFKSIAEWIYDKSNRWCLRSNPKFCMYLETPVAPSSSIKIVENSQTQWINLPLLDDIVRIPTTNFSQNTNMNNSTNYTDCSNTGSYNTDCSKNGSYSDSNTDSYNNKSSFKKKNSTDSSSFLKSSSYKGKIKRSYSTSNFTSY